MGTPQTPLNPTTQSVGFTAKLVTVTAVSGDGQTALTVDRLNTQTQVPMLVQRSKGPLPQVGETWLLTQDLGMWTFAAVVATSAGQFVSEDALAGTGVVVSATAPAAPAVGDLWISGASDNAVAMWNGTSWVPVQFGTQALADGAVTASKIALGAITSAQIAPDAGITASQVAFSLADIGGQQIFTLTGQPQDPQPGDLWVNPNDGNQVCAWNGSTWQPIQFGPGAIQPESLTGAQLATFAGITAGQVDFTASQIGGVTTSVSAAEPPSPATGDLWFDASNDYVLMQWNGTDWVQYQFGTTALAPASITSDLMADAAVGEANIQDGAVTAQQISDAAGILGSQLADGTISGAQISSSVTARSLGGVTTTMSGTSPVGALDGDLWIDTASGNQLEQYEGGTWTPITWDAASVIAAGSIGATLLDGSITSGLSGITTTISATAPSGPDDGDIWLNSSAGYQINQYSGGTWNAIQWNAANVLQAGTVDASVIEAATITGSLIAAGTITAGNIDANTITAAQIAAGTITSAQIAAGTITGDNIAGQTITGTNIVGSTITGDLIAANAITTGLIAAGAVTADQVAAQTITSVQIAANTITAAQIATGSITTTEIASGTIQGDDIEGGTITGDLIAAATIAASNIQSGTITSDLMAAGSVVAGTLDANAIDGMTINAPVINGGTISATDLIASGTDGGFFAYGPGGGGPVVQTFTTTGTFTPPSGITSIKVEAWGGGGQSGSQATGGGAGGGGAEYAAETSLAVVPGQNYAVTVGTAGQPSSFAGSGATTVTANPGGSASGATPGAGGTGSGNSVHYNGGAGGAPSSGATTSMTYTAQSGTWTVPAGVTSITVQCWGPGSGGTGGYTSGYSSGVGSDGGVGGNGGAYASKTIAVTPGTVYNFSTGTGGAGGTVGTSGSPGSGGASFGGGLVYADYADLSPGQASNSTGTTVYSGGGGGNGSGVYPPDGGAGGGGGSSAGSTGNGNWGASASSNNTSSVAGGGAPTSGASGAGGGSGWGGSGATAGGAGATPGGGGGGGGAWTNTAKAGGKGGDGRIIITYFDPTKAGGGGGGSSAGTSSAGAAGKAGNGTSGGSGGAAVNGGGPGAAGGASGSAGTSPSTAPGGGAGGAGSGGAVAVGSRGQVRITYQGSSSLVASLAGASGQDPVTFANIPAGFMGTATAIQPGSSPQAPESWHSLPLPTPSSGSLVSGCYVRYKMLPFNVVMLQFYLQCSGSGYFALNFGIGTLPAGYCPSVTYDTALGVYDTASSGTDQFRLSVGVGGSITLQGSGTQVSWATDCVLIPLD